MLLLKKKRRWGTWLTQSKEHVTLDFQVMSSSPTWGIEINKFLRAVKKERFRWMNGWIHILTFKYLMGKVQGKIRGNSIMLKNKARMSIISTTIQHCTQGIHCT